MHLIGERSEKLFSNSEWSGVEWSEVQSVDLTCMINDGIVTEQRQARNNIKGWTLPLAGAASE